MNINPNPASPAKVVIPAYIDEAGARGKVRNITAAQDAEFGLLCAVAFNPDTHTAAVEAFRKPFDEFCAAAPPDAKLHITDAFSAGNDAWREVAETVREEYLRLISEWRPAVIYAARRLGVARSSYERDQAARAAAEAARRSPVQLVGANRASDERIEDTLMTNLALRLDLFAETACDDQHDVQCVELLFDEIDVAYRYEAAIERTRNISGGMTEVKGWDPLTQQRLQGTVVTKVAAPFRLDTKFLGQISVLGKAHPLVLAADIVTNHLAHHLGQLGPTDPLHASSSVAGWVLEDRVFALDNNSLEDIV